MRASHSIILVLFAASNFCLLHRAFSSTVSTSDRQAPTEPNVLKGLGKISTIDLMMQLSNSSNNDVWLVLPNNLNESQLGKTEFDFFKLNRDQLFGHLSEKFSPMATRTRQESWQSTGDATDDDQVDSVPRSRREARKIKFFPNFMRKPKISPLYLLNGTVCRFVNSQPICTTLSTTGLFGSNTMRPSMNNSISGLLQNQQGQQQVQNQFQQNGQQQGGGLQRQVNPGTQQNLGPRF